MSPLEVRFEDVSGKSSLIVTANLAEGWRQLGNNFGFYGFAHQEYKENDLLTVRVWVIEGASQSYHAPDGFPLDLQSMGSSPSRALAFRLFNGRLSLGAAMSAVVNSRRNNGSPGFFKEAVLIADHGGVAYWLRFYAALNDRHPERPEWTEQDILLAGEGGLPGPGPIGEFALFNFEERLTRVSAEVDALKERVGTLVKDLQERLESGLQAVQGQGAGPAEAAQEERLAVLRKDFQERLESGLQAVQGQHEGPAEAVLEERLAALRKDFQERLESGLQVVQGQGAGPTEAALEERLAALRKDFQERLESGLQAVQEQGAGPAEAVLEERLAALRKDFQERLEGGLKAVQGQSAGPAEAVLEERLAALRKDFQERLESGLQSVQGQGAGLAEAALEERLAALVKDFQGQLESSLKAFQEKGTGQADDSEKAAQELRDQWSKQFEKQAEAAVEKLREEVSNSARALEESKQQLASLAEVKLASLSQVTANAAANLEADQKRLKNQYETLRRELEELITRRLAKVPPTPVEYGSPPKRRGLVAMLGLAAGLLLLATIPPLSVFLSTPPPVQMHLQAQPPADFDDQNPYWSASHRAREQEVAQAYWQAAVASLQGKYPFGADLPANPPADFQIDKKYAPPGGAKALAETRAHYWEKLRTSWRRRQFWVESQVVNEPWAARLRRAWEQIKAK